MGACGTEQPNTATPGKHPGQWRLGDVRPILASPALAEAVLGLMAGATLSEGVADLCALV